MVHQSEVKAAYLTLAKGMLSIEALETVYLKQPIDEPVHAGHGEEEESPFGGEEELFEINDPYIEKEEEGFEIEEEEETEETNATILFTLINRLTSKTVKIAFSMPPSQVRYGRIHLPDVPAKKNLAQRLQDRLRSPKSETKTTVQHTEVLNEDDSSLPMLSQFPPPLYELLQEVNTFTGGKLRLQLLDTNELALIGLVRDNYRLDEDEVTALVHIESDFSRIIFLRGRNLLRVSQMINEPFNSDDLLNIIQSKIIYEQDESEIPDLSRVLISGKGAALRAREYFAKLYPDAEIGYVYSKRMTGILSEDLRGEIFSEFAVPIALAAKALEPKNPSYLPYNLLPDYVLDRQKVLKLAPHGYALLLLLALVAFGFTYKIIAVKSELRQLRESSRLIEAQMGSYQDVLERVSVLDAEIVKYDRLLALADSLGQGHDEMLAFLDELNSSLKNSQAIWINEISKRPNSLNIKGLALNRSKIPVLSSELGNADLKRVTRTNVGTLRAFAFELEKRQRGEELPLLLGEFPLQPGKNRVSTASLPPVRRTSRTAVTAERTSSSAARPADGAARATASADGKRSAKQPVVAERSTENKPEEKTRSKQVSSPPSATDPAQVSPKTASNRQRGSKPVERQTATQKAAPATASNNPVSEVRKAVAQRAREMRSGQRSTGRPPSSGEFTIEVGLYSSRQEAVAASKRLGNTGFALYIQRVFFPKKKQTVYRLILGSFSTRETAVRAAALLEPRLPRGARVLQVP
jgi:hypothetical protein